ncbi:FG-GAP-like repeat-containing protein [Streptomyces sp. XY431]|uniref:FG-GAP-like repeat-containing protein n=1 Tax=Streptomyces sp. XY431 TaxID=1415562 RepID=UPI00099C18F5|nr:FG-GAP-like repeat-containing protein [Streptomyces sp. XY431]
MRSHRAGPRARGRVPRPSFSLLALGLALVLALGLAKGITPAPSARDVHSACGLPVAAGVTAGGSRVTCGEEARAAHPMLNVAADDVVIDYVFDGVNQAMMQDAIDRVHRPGVRLSDQALDLMRSQRQYFQGAPLDLVDIDSVDDFSFDGTLRATDHGIAVVVPRSEVGQASWGTWLRAVAVLVTATAVRAAVFGLCISFAPPPAEALFVDFCSAASQGFGTFTGYMMTAYFQGRAASDPQLWAEALAFGLVGALLPGAGWDVGKPWMVKNLAGAAATVGRGLQSLATSIRSWAGETISDLVAAGGVMFTNLSARIWAAVVAEANRRGVPLSLAQVRVMPLGDSITLGTGSRTTSSYRAELWDALKSQNDEVDFVGSQSAGVLPDDDHEGHSGWRIDQIADLAECSLPYYRPNIVTLHAGTNDMNQNYLVDSAPLRLDALVDRTLHLLPGVTVLVATLVPSTKPDVGARIQEYNRSIVPLVQRMAAQGKRVRLVDMSAVTTADLYDQLHPNDTGYRKMGRAFTEAIAHAAAEGLLAPVAGGQEGGNPCAPPVVPVVWKNWGRIATGAGSNVPGADGAGTAVSGAQVRFAEINGDNRADYLVVQDNGAVRAWLNTPGDGGRPSWTSLGVIAPGTGAPGDHVQFADVNGDGRDDYLVVQDNAAVFAWLNTPGTGGVPSWRSLGLVAPGVPGVTGDLVRFADYDGDGRDDYLVVDSTGRVHAWRNTPGDNGVPSWQPRGLFAEGVDGATRDKLRFADINGDGRADYLVVQDNGAVLAWANAGGTGFGGWTNQGVFASGVGGATRDKLRFADVNGDRRADYLMVAPDSAVDAWLNQVG